MNVLEADGTIRSEVLDALIALIENLDSRSMFLLPEEDQSIGVYVYEELLADLVDELGNS